MGRREWGEGVGSDSPAPSPTRPSYGPDIFYLWMFFPYVSLDRDVDAKANSRWNCYRTWDLTKSSFVLKIDDCIITWNDVHYVLVCVKIYTAGHVLKCRISQRRDRFTIPFNQGKLGKKARGCVSQPTASQLADQNPFSPISLLSKAQNHNWSTFGHKIVPFFTRLVMIRFE